MKRLTLLAISFLIAISSFATIENEQKGSNPNSGIPQALNGPQAKRSVNNSQLTISAAAALADNTTVQVAGTVTYVLGANFWIQDATAGILCYQRSHGLSVGDAVELSATKSTYGGIAELINITVLSQYSYNHIEPAVTDIATIIATPNDWMSEYVSIADSKVAFSNDSIFLTDAANNKIFCYKWTLDQAYDGKTVDVEAIVGKYNKTLQLRIISYTLKTSSSNTFSFTLLGGDSVAISSGQEELNVTNLVIPSTTIIDGETYRVTAIADNAFRENYSISSVTIPDGVTSIGKYAFRNCYSLTDINIGNSVVVIGYEAFYNCSNLTKVTWNVKHYEHSNSYSPLSDIASQITSFTIGNNVETIPANMCSNMSKLTKIIIPNNVTTIGVGAFSECSSLTSVIIPNSVTSIAGAAFEACSSLASITLPNGITTIGGSTFKYCSNLTKVSIPNSVTTIGGYAFEGCSSLMDVTIGNRVTTIEWGAFEGCSSLTKITIPNSVTTIMDRAFAHCSNLNNITLSNNLTTISLSMFLECSSLPTISIPNSVNNISAGAFEGCSNLQYNTYDNAKYLGNSGNPHFALIEPTSTSITSCKIHKDTKIFATGALYNCSNLHTIMWNAKSFVVDFNNAPFENIASQITSFAFGTDVDTIPADLCSGMNKLTEIIIPNNVSTIGENAFGGCSNLAEVIIGNHVTSIGSGAFASCTSLSGITIPPSVTTIGWGAFQHCDSLTEITIPNSVSTLGRVAFSLCPNLEIINVEAGNPTYHSAGNCIIETAKRTLHTGCKNSTIPTDGSVTAIDTTAFFYCTSLTKITIPNNITSIGISAFACCSNLTSVTIGSGVTYIDELAFDYCTKLTEITCKAITPPTIASCIINDGPLTPDEPINGELEYAFEGVDKTIPLYVPAESVAAYKAAEGWNEFTNIQGVDFLDGVENITSETIDAIRKVIENGTIYILRDGEAYTTDGRKVK